MGLLANPSDAFGDESPGSNDPALNHSATSNIPRELLGSWIWDAKVFDGQTCQFWRAIDIPTNSTSNVINARLLLTADNEFTLFFDGHEIGHGAEWRELFDYNLTPLMSPGRHVLAIKALNPTGTAGMLLGMRVELANGQLLEIKSDQSWKIAPNEAKNWNEMPQPPPSWPAAKIVGTIGTSPWKMPMRVVTGNNNTSPNDSVTSNNPLELLGSWIWDDKLFDGQTCQFWRAIDIPAHTNKVINARLLLTADNEFTLFFDGREIGHGADWRELFDYNLTLLMSPGRHVLAVKAMNPTGFAGMLLGLRIELANGQLLEIKSDPSWKIAPNQAKSWNEMTRPPTSWPPAKIVGTLGALPWWTTPVRVNPILTPVPIEIFFWQTAWFQVPFFIACGLVALTIFSLAAQLALHQKEHWLLQRERARIAMDVHDDIGSRMTHLVLNGEVIQDELPADSKARAQVGQICDEARGVLSSIDEILWALNPRRDTLQDFADYVCDYTQKFLGPANIECVFDVDSETLNAAADLPLRRSLLMAIKETLNNTVKYSAATELSLQIVRQRQTLVVVVQDNGCGFDPAATRPGRNGLGNMSRRMQELGGNCSISTGVGKGCRIEFSIPLRNPRRLSLSWMWQRKKRLTPANEESKPDKASNQN